MKVSNKCSGGQNKMNYVLAFVVGGLICVAVQLLMDNTKLLPGRIMVILVCLEQCLEQLEFMNRLQNGRGKERQFRCLDLATLFGKV